MLGGAESDCVCTKCGMMVGGNLDYAFKHLVKSMSKEQREIVKKINTDWMIDHMTLTLSENKELLLGKGESREYKIYNPQDFDDETLEAMNYNKKEKTVFVDEDEFTHMCCKRHEKELKPWIAKLKKHAKSVFNGQYFRGENFILKVLGYKKWKDYSLWDWEEDENESPEEIFKKIPIAKFEELAELLTSPLGKPVAKVKKIVETYDDSKYLNPTLLDTYQKDDLKILSVKIKVELEAPAKKEAPKNVALFSGFRDADLQARAEAKGWEVKSSFSKAVTLLVVKDASKETEKTKKARENNIEIVTKDDFLKKL